LKGALLALPFALMYTLLVLHIEPPLGLLVTLSPIVRDAKAGCSFTTHSVNLALATVILLFVVAFVVSFVVDQYPCWIGVPNCD
jgi:hypothetical protein